MRGLEVESEANAEHRRRLDLADRDEVYLLATIELDLMRGLRRDHQRLDEVGARPGLEHFVEHVLSVDRQAVVPGSRDPDRVGAGRRWRAAAR